MHVKPYRNYRLDKGKTLFFSTRKNFYIFLILPTDILEDGTVAGETIFNLDHIVSIGSQRTNRKCGKIITDRDVERDGTWIYLPYDKLKIILKIALEDNITDAIPIINRAEILDIEK